MIHDRIFSSFNVLESINLYYFNIIKKYTSHMYDLKKRNQNKFNTYNYFPFLSWLYMFTKHQMNFAKVKWNTL